MKDGKGILLSNPLMSLKKLEHILLFLALFFLPTQLGRHFWPQFSYIYSLKIDYLSPTLYFWDILVIILIFSWLAQNPRINKLAVNLSLFFLITQVISLLNSYNVGAGLFRLEQYTLSSLFGVYIASQKWYELRPKLILPFILGIIGEGVITLAQFLKGSTVGLWILGERSFTISTPGIAKFDFYGKEFLRPYATFPHPNILAAYLLITTLLLESVRGHAFKFWSLSTVLVGSAAIFLTVSRAAILASVTVLFFKLKGRWLVLILVFLIILLPVLYTRFISLINFDNLTLLRREQLAEDAIKVFLSSPVFGVGLNNFIPYTSGEIITGPSRFLQPVHNIYLLLLSETGLIGAFGFVFFLIYSLRSVPNKNILLIWMVILFLGIFDHFFLTLPQGYRLFFLVWGLTLSCSNKRLRLE